MKRIALSALVAVVALSWAAGDARAQAPNTYVTIATGTQEDPPVATTALSIAALWFTAGDAAFVGYRLNRSHDQEVQMVHIHEAPVGVDGPIVLNMRPTEPGEGFCVDILGGLITIYLLTDAALRGSLEGGSLTDLKNLMATGRSYINLHTPENPGGWIRGQMIPVPGY